MPNSNSDELDTETTNHGDNPDAIEIPPPAPNPDAVEFATMSEREKAFVNKARADEKRKLYKAKKDLEDQLEKAKSDLRAAQNQPAPTTAQAVTRADKMDAVLEQIAANQAALAQRLDKIQTDEIKRREQSELATYTSQRLAALAREGKGLIETLVGGDSEEEIDNSILIAQAEYQLAVQHHQQRNPPNGRTPSSITVQNGRNGRPTGAVPVQVPNTVEADSDSENIADLTSDSSVRDGSYEKNRSKLFSGIKRGYRYSGSTQ